MTTLLVQPDQLDADQIQVEGDPYRHLFRAKRLAAGDPLRLVDGQGRAREGTITLVDRKSAQVKVGAEAPSLEPTRHVELLVAPIRHQRASWMVEKATELGVQAVRFVQTERVNHDLTPDGLARLQRMARAALQQCGRSRLPEVDGPHGWEELPALLTSLPDRFVLDPRAAQGPEVAEGKERVAILIGPEGGWSEAEREALAKLDCQPLFLGERVLRTETAALTTASLFLTGV